MRRGPESADRRQHARRVHDQVPEPHHLRHEVHRRRVQEEHGHCRSEAGRGREVLRRDARCRCRQKVCHRAGQSGGEGHRSSGDRQGQLRLHLPRGPEQRSGYLLQRCRQQCG